MTADAEAIAQLKAELAAARAELRELEERYDVLANNSQAILSRIDTSGRITYVSPSIRKVLGYEPSELVGQVGFSFIDPAEQEARRAAFARGLSTGTAPIVTARSRRKDGTYVWMEYYTETLRDADGNVTGFQSTSRDVTARREAEDALRQSEAHFESFVRDMPVPALIHKDTKFVLVNRALTQVFGYSEADLLGTSLYDLVVSDDRAYVASHIRVPPEQRAGMRTREHQIVHKDGSRIPVEVTSVPVFFRGELCPMGVIHDLRERKHLEAQLITADRLASLGRLAAAVGHEINNPLAYVLGSLSLIDRELAHLDTGSAPERARQIHELLANVREGAERIRAVVVDLKALSREPADRRGPVDLAHVLDLCASMADHEVRHRARLVKDYAELPLVQGSEARLGQVFLNLLINAAEAIPEGDIDGNEIRLEARVSSPGHVAVDVVDTGTGIPPELANHLFEPFFTSKAGVGTGLGLSISQHIVASLGGTIAVMPSSPRGTRFRVVLPCVPDVQAAPPVTSEKTSTPHHDPATERRAVRILVVDDEPQLAQLIARLLRPREVDIAHGGQEAVDRLTAGERYDVILCDLHMNDLSGMDVYQHIQRHFGDLAKRMVFMTGGVVSSRARDFAASCGCPVLDKPFDAGTLEAAIDAAIHVKASPA